MSVKKYDMSQVMDRESTLDTDKRRPSLSVWIGSGRPRDEYPTGYDGRLLGELNRDEVTALASEYDKRAMELENAADCHTPQSNYYRDQSRHLLNRG